jgi:hypothetical protein
LPKYSVADVIGYVNKKAAIAVAGKLPALLGGYDFLIDMEV